MRSARLAIGLVLIAIGGSWWLFRRVPSVRQIEPPAILTQVRQLNQLASIQYTVQKVVAIREQKQPVGSESILLILQGNRGSVPLWSEIKLASLGFGMAGSRRFQRPP